MTTTSIQDLQQERTAPASFPVIIERYKSELARALPKHLSADRMSRIALTEFRKNPKLGACEPRSIFAAVIMSSQLGLEPGVRGRSFLVPYWNAKTHQNECQLIPGWMGLLDLVNRTGRATAWTGAVFAGDEFEYQLGDKPFIHHRPGDAWEPEKLTHAYAVGRVNGAEHPIIEVWTAGRLRRHFERYNKVGDRHYAQDNWEMYCRKIVLLQVLKYLPASIELESAIAMSYAADAGPQGINLRDALDGQSWVPPAVQDDQSGPGVAGHGGAGLGRQEEQNAPPAEKPKRGRPAKAAASPQPAAAQSAHDVQKPDGPTFEDAISLVRKGAHEDALDLARSLPQGQFAAVEAAVTNAQLRDGFDGLD